MIWKLGKKLMAPNSNNKSLKKFSILFVCTGNICRSPMAAGLLKHLLPAHLMNRVSVTSAGIYALHGNQPAADAVETMARHGIDIRAHRAQQVNRDRINEADLTLAMEKRQVKVLRAMILWNKDQISLLSAFNPIHDPEDSPDIEDPYGAPLTEYQACYRILRPCIDGLIQWLTANENITAADH